MRKHIEPALKIVCLILAALVLYQFVGIIRRVNPLRGVTVPALPTLAASTNNSSSGVPLVSSNAIGTAAEGTNLSSLSRTNSKLTGGTPGLLPTGTNVISTAPSTNNVSTNLVVRTNSVTPTGTNLPASAKTNAGHTVIVQLPIDTNKIVSATGTNNISTNLVTPTNSVGLAANQIKTNRQSGNELSSTGRMPMRGGMGMGKQTTLPPAIQAQVSKIIDSEILGPVPHPLPMALMGIAGDVAFLRAPDGQTGMVKLGDSLGEIKLVRIGINRVLVEQDGQPKELTIFNGYGGESLLEKQGGTNHETHE